MTPFQMPTPFIITGLPRCRTAWLSNLMTYDGAKCLHEGMAMGEDRLCEWLQAEELRGDSDCALPLVWPKIKARISRFRLVVITRPLCDAITSTVRFLASEYDQEHATATAEFVARGVSKLLDSEPCLHVEFNELGKSEVLRKIWEYCVPSKSFDEMRADMLQRLDIQQHIPATKLWQASLMNHGRIF